MDNGLRLGQSLDGLIDSGILILEHVDALLFPRLADARRRVCEPFRPRGQLVGDGGGVIDGARNESPSYVLRTPRRSKSLRISTVHTRARNRRRFRYVSDAGVPEFNNRDALVT